MAEERRARAVVSAVVLLRTTETALAIMCGGICVSYKRPWRILRAGITMQSLVVLSALQKACHSTGAVVAVHRCENSPIAQADVHCGFVGIQIVSKVSWRKTAICLMNGTKKKHVLESQEASSLV